MYKKLCYGRSSIHIALCLLLAFGLIDTAPALEPVLVTGSENGNRLHPNLEIWHDPGGTKGLQAALEASRTNRFGPLPGAGSTGFQPGAFWGHFYLRNTAAAQVTVHLEYMDHQLIYLNAFQRSGAAATFVQIADLSMNDPFSRRPIAHQRFVFPVVLAAGETAELMVQYGSDDRGFVFPDLRIWQPERLRQAQTVEVATVAFFNGGLFLMAIIALVGGLATGDRSFYAYSVYALTKIMVWWTILGFTHQYFIRSNFHWSYMSLSGALTIFSGIWFARIFLQTRKNIPRFDYLLILMLGNAAFLLVVALADQTALAVISITVALLLYPLICIAAVLRWYQGSREAGIFALAWAFLVVGLFAQALRDLGLVENNFINYYWPPLATYTEMIVIMVAMGLRVHHLRQQKDEAERLYTEQLENTKTELEALVSERTKDLEAAKIAAETEARTDPLTGTNNRRSFLLQAETLLKRSKKRSEPFSILMFDIDSFKSINDNYGHSVGDQALVLFAETIMLEVRDTDIFGRLGGEEFSLVLTSAKAATLQTAERLREVVSKLCIETEKGELRFTTSIGVAHLSDSDTIDSLLYRADTALYQAKQNGRNRVEAAESDVRAIC